MKHLKIFLSVLVCLVLAIACLSCPSFAATEGQAFYPPANWPWGSTAVSAASSGNTEWRIPYVMNLADGSYQYTFERTYSHFGEWQQSSESGQFSDAWICSDRDSFGSYMASYGLPFFYYPSWVSTRLLISPVSAVVSYRTSSGAVKTTVVEDGLSSVPCSVNFYVQSATVDGSGSVSSYDWTVDNEVSYSCSLGSIPSLSFGSANNPDRFTELTGCTGFTGRVSCSNSDFAKFVSDSSFESVVSYRLYMQVAVTLVVPVSQGSAWIGSYPDFCYENGVIVIPDVPSDDWLDNDLPFTDSEEYFQFASFITDMMSWRLLNSMLSVVLVLAVIKFLLY